MPGTDELDQHRVTKPTSPFLDHLGGSFELDALLELCFRETHYQRLSKSDEEDVAQKALTELVERSATVENPLAYLKVVLRREARSTREASRRSVPLDEVPGGEASAQDPWAAADSRIDAQRLLEPLAPTDRRLLRLASEGYSFAEIGEALGVTAGAARTRISRLRKKLSAAA